MSALVLVAVVLAVSLPAAAWVPHRLAAERRRWDARQRLAEQLRRLTAQLAPLVEQIGTQLLPSIRNFGAAVNALAAAAHIDSRPKGNR